MDTNPDDDPNRELRFQFRAAASLHTEARDFSRWLIALANREGLSDEGFARLFEPHAIAGSMGPVSVHYTLGFFHPRIPGTQVYFHGGNNGDFSAFFALDVERGWGFALFTNSAFGEALGNELLFYLLAGPRGGVLLGVAGAVGIGVLVLVVWGLVSVRRRRMHPATG